MVSTSRFPEKKETGPKFRGETESAMSILEFLKTGEDP
jgi:hypothetical protein